MAFSRSMAACSILSAIGLLVAAKLFAAANAASMSVTVCSRMVCSSLIQTVMVPLLLPLIESTTSTLIGNAVPANAGRQTASPMPIANNALCGFMVHPFPGW